MQVEIVRLEEAGCTVLARGEILEQQGIVLCPDGVVRLSDLCWDTMTPEVKKAFLMKFNAVEV